MQEIDKGLYMLPDGGLMDGRGSEITPETDGPGLFTAEAVRSRNNLRTVYLCGGINGLADVDAKDWREVAKPALYAAGFKVLDPMRRDFRGREAESVKEIVQGDLFDIQASQIILVNASRPSWGTAMEVAHARCDVHRKQIYAFGAGASPSPWLVYHMECGSHAQERLF